VDATTLALINARIAGTGVVLKTADVADLIPAATRWLTQRYADAGLTAPSGATRAHDLALEAQTLYVLTKIAFAGFSFGKADAAGRFDFSGRRWQRELTSVLTEIGFGTDGEFVKTIERGVDYGVTGDVLPEGEFYI
jgi:hypothetical protein